MSRPEWSSWQEVKEEEAGLRYGGRCPIPLELETHPRGTGDSPGPLLRPRREARCATAYGRFVWARPIRLTVHVAGFFAGTGALAEPGGWRCLG